MQLSIILINYNSWNYTKGCIESIFKSHTRFSFEVILIDNASSENLFNDIIVTYPGVKCIRNKENVGFAKANNIGIGHAAGDVILLLNNDTVINESTLQITYDALEINPYAGALTCQLRYPDGRIQHNCQPFPSKKRQNIEKLRLHKLMSRKKRSAYMQGFYWDYGSPGYPDWIWGTYFMFRKNVLEKLPGKKLNDEYFMYIEDMQWCWDIRKVGYEISYTPDTHVIHFGGGSGGTKEGLMKENMERFIRKNYG